MTETAETSTPIRWWGEYRLAEHETGRWRIGPLSLWISGHAREWRLAYERGENALDPALEVRCPLPDAAEAEVPETAERIRMATQHLASVLELEPALADRGVVSRPEVPFQLLPDDQVDLFVSTPLWLRVLVGDGFKHCLLDVPLTRPSDTWIGPDTTRGTLAYASRTFMRLDEGKLPAYPGRAVTRIRLQNRAATPLSLERLQLPVRGLSLYADDAGRLWTDAVTLTREPSGENAALRIGSGPSEADVAAEPIAGPREVSRRRSFMEALSSLLG